MVSLLSPSRRSSTETPGMMGESNRSEVELILGLPPPLISLLVRSSGLVHTLAHLSLIARWSHPRGLWLSFLAIFGWWSVCLIGPTVIRLGGPNLILACALGYGYFFHSKQNTSTQQKFQKTITTTTPEAVIETLRSYEIVTHHLELVANQLQPIKELIEWKDPNRSLAVLSACLISVPACVILTRVVKLNIIIMIMGSILIIWPSRWFRTLTRLVWKSAIVRSTVRCFLILCFHAGAGLSAEFNKTIYHRQSIKLWATIIRSAVNDHPIAQQSFSPNASELSIPTNANLIEFKFTIFENQRWWMGLDWTSNTLPHERPNWTDSSLCPVSSPASFKLPSPYTTTTHSSTTPRKVEWKWIDQDWKICKAHPAPGTGYNEEHNPVPTHLRDRLKSIRKVPSIIGSASSVSVSKTGANGTLSHQQPNGTHLDHPDSSLIDESLRRTGLSATVTDGGETSSTWDVDSDGWQYGDNLWANMSRKGGIGRYTRRRAWLRRAVMVTTTDTNTPEDTPSTNCELGVPLSSNSPCNGSEPGIPESPSKPT